MHQWSLSELQGAPTRRTTQDQDQDQDQDRWSRRPRGAGRRSRSPARGAPLWAWLLLGALALPGAWSFLTEEQEELLVELHNHYRGQVSPSASAMMPLKWDPSLKLVAEGYAAKCIWNHNPELEDTGENLYSSTGKLDLREAVEKWFLEHLYYDFQNNSCDEDQMCGHYTQMVWADTHRLGCAFHLCSSMEGLEWERISFLVCNYYPAGNYEGLRPYVEGDWCSQCPENLQKCENNLCVADTEDEDEDEQADGLDEDEATAEPSPRPAEEEEEQEEEQREVVPPPATTESYLQPPTSSSSSSSSSSSASDPEPTQDSEETPAPGTPPPEVPTEGEKEKERVVEEEEVTEEREEEERREPTDQTKRKEDKDVSVKIFQRKDISVSSRSQGLSAPPVLMGCLLLTLRL